MGLSWFLFLWFSPSLGLPFTSALPSKCQKIPRQNLLSTLSRTCLHGCTHPWRRTTKPAELLFLPYDLGNWGHKTKVRELLPQTQGLYQVWVLSTEQCLHQTSPRRGQVWGKGYKIENTWRRKEKWRIRSPIKICQKGIRKERKCGSSQEKAEGRRKAEGAAHERGGHPVHLASRPATSTAERPRATGRNLWTIKNCLFLYATNDKTVIKCNGCFPRVIAVNIFNRSSKCFGV